MDRNITAAGVLVVSSDNKILAFARRGDVNRLGLPAGFREKNEELIACAQREIFEETGFKIKLGADDKTFVYKPDDNQKNNIDEYCITFIKRINEKSDEMKIGLANKDENGITEGFGLWVSPEDFIASGNSAFIDYNTHLLKFAGLI